MAFGEGKGRPRPDVAFGPPPHGFDLTPYSVGDRETRSLSDRGLCFWLSDALIDLTGPQKVFTSRVVQEVLGGDGLQSAATFEIVFDPSYERLIIHAARVHRNGDVRESASPEAFEVLRRELNLERAIYDGRVTAHMIIPDVRVGDVVETSFSIVGSNPATGGRLGHFLTLQWSSPTVETRCRLRLPRDRKVTWRKFGSVPDPEDLVDGDVRSLTWRVLDREPWRPEPDTPPWWVGYDAVHVMDDCCWADVADLFRPHYAPPADLPSELRARIADIAERHATPAARAAEALRFAQRELRYLSVGVGEGGLRPREVETIWATRYGDCKDASRLLATMLEALGVKACPALVDTSRGEDLERSPPFAGAFNHCIVRAEIDGKAWWLDPTRAPQAGSLQALTPVFHHFALPLVADARLEAMAQVDPPWSTDALETWSFSRRPDQGAELDIVTTYRGGRADNMRNWAENDGLATIARRMREDLESTYGPMDERAPMDWRDRPEINELECVERYQVVWPYAGDREDRDSVRFETRDDVVGAMLRTPDSGRRRAPIDLGPVRRQRTRRVFKFATNTNIRPWDQTHTGPGCHGRSVMTVKGPKEAELLLEVSILAETAPAEKMAEYFAFARRMRNANGFSLNLLLKDGKIVPADHGEMTWVGWVVAALVVAGALALKYYAAA